MGIYPFKFTFWILPSRTFFYRKYTSYLYTLDAYLYAFIKEDISISFKILSL